MTTSARAFDLDSEVGPPLGLLRFAEALARSAPTTERDRRLVRIREQETRGEPVIRQATPAERAAWEARRRS